MPRPSQVSQLTKESQLDFLAEMYDRGIELPKEKFDQLVAAGRIKLNKNVYEKDKKYTERAVVSDIKTDIQQRADAYIDIVVDMEDVPGYEEDKRHIILDSDSYDKLSETSLFSYTGGRTITPEDWKPKDKIQHTDEFVHWINSINRGFQSMVRYKPFAMYCQQSKDWIEEGSSILHFTDREGKKQYATREFDRCKQNTLYFMDKYLMLKEGDVSTGTMKYESKPVHKVLCYLIDCGYSLMVGKPRQIAATSTIGGVALCKTLFNKNFFLKMIAQDKEKVIEIFDDKIKYPFGELPEWMKPEVGNDTGTMLRFRKKTEKKGSKKGVNSKLQVVAPSVSAINGGSPQLVLIDEAGYIDILAKMIKEARPTMFMQNPITGKLEMKRQIIVWGTGGEMDKGGKSFENEFYSNLKLFEEGKYESGMIPLFFDWTTRPGISKTHYLNEKRVYTVEGPDKEKKAVQFRQTYPSIIEDMFLSSYKLLVGVDWINEQKERIRKQKEFRPTSGYFEPIYDESKPTDENSDVPFKITGSRFVQVDDRDEHGSSSCLLLVDPKRGWHNRYYQGTDPIMTDNGFSNMASVIFDAYWNTPVCVMNYRDPDHKYTFLQCMLMGLYFDTLNKGGVPELVESNVGMAYIDYKEAKGFYNSLVHKAELPTPLQGGGQLVGIDNRSFRNKLIVDKMYEVNTAYGAKFYFQVIFDQLRTFVCKISDSGNEQWGVTDPRAHKDDVLFGLVFAYICTECFRHRPPIDMTSKANQSKVVYELKRDTNGNLTRVAKMIPVV